MMQHLRLRALLLGLMQISLFCVHGIRADETAVIDAISHDVVAEVESVVSEVVSLVDEAVVAELSELLTEAEDSESTSISRLDTQREDAETPADEIVAVVEEVDNTHVERFAERVRTNHQWLLWCHANGDNSLADFIDYNTSDMATANINDNILVLVQADRPNDVGTFRYQVTPDKVTLLAHLSYEMGQQPGKEVVDGMSWAQANYSFNNVILDLWGHGSGIQDPNFRRHEHRGILFDDTNATYLNNQAMSATMDQIAANLGKSIDIFGTDACLMAGLEVGWQVRNSVARLVASETTEPGSGWSYAPFLNAIAADASISADDVARAIVKAYGDFYAQGTDAYTLSAMDLTKLQAVVDALHAMMDGIKRCMQQDKKNTMVALINARARSLEMDVIDYVDLYSFLNALNVQLGRVKFRNIEGIDVASLDGEVRGPAEDIIMHYLNPEEKRALKSEVAALRSLVKSAMNTVDAAVLANRAGNGMQTARGISIYFPRQRTPIDPSYPKTKFAQETRWYTDFLVKIMGYKKVS